MKKRAPLYSLYRQIVIESARCSFRIQSHSIILTCHTGNVCRMQNSNARKKCVPIDWWCEKCCSVPLRFMWKFFIVTVFFFQSVHFRWGFHFPLYNSNPPHLVVPSSQVYVVRVVSHPFDHSQPTPNVHNPSMSKAYE